MFQLCEVFSVRAVLQSFLVIDIIISARYQLIEIGYVLRCTFYYIQSIPYPCNIELKYTNILCDKYILLPYTVE